MITLFETDLVVGKKINVDESDLLNNDPQHIALFRPGVNCLFIIGICGGFSVLMIRLRIISLSNLT